MPLLSLFASDVCPQTPQKVVTLVLSNNSRTLREEFTTLWLSNNQHTLCCTLDLAHLLWSWRLQRQLYGTWVEAIDMTFITSDDPCRLSTLCCFCTGVIKTQMVVTKTCNSGANNDQAINLETLTQENYSVHLLHADYCAVLSAQQSSLGRFSCLSFLWCFSFLNNLLLVSLISNAQWYQVRKVRFWIVALARIFFWSVLPLSRATLRTTAHFCHKFTAKTQNYFFFF